MQLKLELTEKKVLIISFFIGLSLRVFIESLSFYPVGVDVPIYAYQIELYLRQPSWDLLYLGSPLIFVIGAGLKLITDIDSFMIWKFISPVLNGFTVMCFAFLLTKGLKWNLKKILFAVIFFSFYFVQIIHSNGMFCQQLGSAFLFLTLSYYINNNIKKTIFYSILTVLSHQLSPLLLFGIITLDSFSKLYRRKCIVGNLKLLVIILFSVFLISFFLPSLSSSNPLNEVKEYISSFLFSGAYGGVTYEIETSWWSDMLNHFYIYCGMLILFAFIGIYKEDVLLSWFGLTLVLSFIPLGWTFKRWQWLLTQPLVIFSVHGLYKFKKFKYLDLVKYGVLTIIIVYGIRYSINPNTILRSSVAFNEIPDLNQAYFYLSNNITDNTLLITSNENFRLYELLSYHENKNPIVIRISMLLEEGEKLYVYCTAVRGLDYYIFRQKEVKIDVTTYDKVFMLKDSYDEQHFEKFEHYFTKINEFGSVEVYELCLCGI